MAQIQSLVEYGSFIIDESIFIDTGDKYFYNNHFYSDKPPILALYASPFYFLLHKLGLSFDNNLGLTYYLVTLLSIGSLSALGLTVFRKILRDFLNTSDQWADLVTLITGVGTLILPYSLIFNNHIPSGVLLIIGFYFLLNFLRNGKLINAIYSGFFFSLAGGIDITCFLFIPFVLILVLSKSFKAGIAFAISCLPIILLYLFLNLVTSGSIVPPAMNPELWNYSGSAFNQENLSGLAQHQNIFQVLFYGFHLLFGNRGIFSHSPLLWISIVSMVITSPKRRSPYRKEYAHILLACLLYIVIYILRTNNYSGWGFSIRWFSSLMLILCLPMGCIENEVRSSQVRKFIFISIFCLSVFISLIGAYNPMTPAEFQDLFNPSHTIVVNVKLIVANLVTGSIQAKLFNLIPLVISSLTIYLLLYRFIKNLESLNPVQSTNR